jgi:hypothetical protein
MICLNVLPLPRREEQSAENDWCDPSQVPHLPESQIKLNVVRNYAISRVDGLRNKTECGSQLRHQQSGWIEE